jgi:hypothetical protein
LVEILEQTEQRQQILIAEEGTPGSDTHKRISQAHIGPGGRQRVEVTIHQMEEDPILSPGVPVGHERKLAPMQRVIRMRYAKGFGWKLAVRCS